MQLRHMSSVTCHRDTTLDTTLFTYDQLRLLSAAPLFPAFIILSSTLLTHRLRRW